MAIAFDAATDGSFVDTTNTFSHTCTGTDRILFVVVATDGVTPSVATYAGVAMTLVQSETGSGTRDHFLYMLVNPASGANNVVVTGASGNIFAGAVSYTGAKQTGQPDSSNKAVNASATSLTGSTTVVVGGCWLVALGQHDGGGVTSAGSGTTKRTRYGGFDQFAILDSNGTKSNGSQSLIATSNGSAAAMQVLIASIVPAPVANPILVDTFDRGDQAGWGTASGGGAWTVTDTSKLTIATNQGRILAFATTNNAIHDLSQDNDIAITFKVNAWVAVTDCRYVMIKANGGNRDGFGLEIGTGTSNNLTIRDSTTSPIAQGSFTFTAGVTYLFEIDISATYAMAVYVWASGGSKPGVPNVSSAAASRTGAGTKFMMGSNSNAADFDDLSIVTTALTTQLVSYWRLDEASGDAADAVGGNNLTNTNTVTYSGGKLFNGANFVAASSQNFTKADIFEYQKGQAMSMSFWFKLTATGVNYVLGGNAVSAAAGGWRVEYLATNKLRFALSNATSDGYIDETNAFGYTTGTWYHAVCTTSNFGVPSAMKIYINGSAVTVTEAATLNATAITYGTSQFRLGARYVTPATYLNGNLDEVGIWERELTSTEVTSLYNSGSGMYYLDGAFTATADAKNDALVAYWKMDESSGTAFDAHNSYDMTNNGTVPYIAAKINNGADLEATDVADTFSNTILDWTTDVSFALWIKPETIQANGVLIGQYAAGINSFQFLTASATNHIYFRWWDASGNDSSRTSSGSVISNGSWFHVVVTVDISAGGTGIKFYVNGTETTYATSTSNANTKAVVAASLFLGSLDGTQSWYDGVLDEVGMWSRILTSTEVTELYNAGAGKAYPFAAAAAASATGNFFLVM